MVLISSKKYACETCIKGHRSSACKHTDRPLFEIKKKGRPVTQCEHCRELRKTKQVHVKCICESKEPASPTSPTPPPKKKGTPTLPAHAAFPHGVPEALEAVLAAEASSDSDHGGSGCCCKAGAGECNCCTPRKRPSRRRSQQGSPPPPHTITALNSGATSSAIPPAHNTPSPTIPPPPTHSRTPSHHILARIAELRPVLPRPSARDVLLGAAQGGQHDLFHHLPSLGHPPHHAHEHFSPYGRAYDYALHGEDFYKQDGRSVESFQSAGTSKSHKSASQKSPSTSPSCDGAAAPGGFFAAHQQQQQPIEWRLPPSLARSEAAFRPQRPDAVPRPRSEDAYPLRSASDALHARTASDDEAFPPPRSTTSDDVRTCGCGDGCACPGCALHATAPPPEHASCAAAACGGACLDCTILSLPDFSAVVGFGGGGGSGRAGGAGLRFADDYGAGSGGEYGRLELELEGYEERRGVEGLGVEGFEERLEGYDEAFALDAYGAGAGAATYDASQAQAIDEWIREVSALPPASPVPPFEFPDGAAVFGDPTAPSPFHTQQEQRQREEEQMFGEDDGASAFGQPAWGAVEMFDVDVGVELDGDTPALVAPVPGALKLNGLASPGLGAGGENVHFLTVPGPGAHARSRSSSSASSEVSAGAGGSGAGLAGVGGDLAGLSLDAPKPTPSNPHPAAHPNVTAQVPDARALFAFPPPAFMDDEQMLFY